MAVSLANELSVHIDKSILCVSREEGLLKSTIAKDVDYYFLNKRSAVDIVSFIKLFSLVKKNKIKIIHAHSSSFFYATFLKIVRPKLKLIWHDHYGNSEALDSRKYSVLHWSSRFFSTIISVNELLKQWAIINLKCKDVVFLNNFVSESEGDSSDIVLDGAEDYRIVCLANLRPQKDHLNLIKAFQVIKMQYPLASLHLIGKINYNQYYETINEYIATNNLKAINVYGAQSGVMSLLRSASVGVLSSKSEGLPVALLEYGLAGIPVVCTDVGQCKEVVLDYGKIVPSDNFNALAEAVIQYFENADERKQNAQAFSRYVKRFYSFEIILPMLLTIYNK